MVLAVVSVVVAVVDAADTRDADAVAVASIDTVAGAVVDIERVGR